MNIKPGTILLSAPLLEDPNFEKVVIFIAEYNKKGALGFVINKLFPRTFNELVEFKQSASFPLYEGGPVENESLFFIHSRSDLIDGGVFVNNAIYLGGNFKQAVEHIDHKTINEKEIKLFIGYCGWDPMQLEGEIEEGSWLIADATEQVLFMYEPAMLWEKFHEEIKNRHNS